MGCDVHREEERVTALLIGANVESCVVTREDVCHFTMESGGRFIHFEGYEGDGDYREKMRLARSCAVFAG